MRLDSTSCFNPITLPSSSSSSLTKISLQKLSFPRRPKCPRVKAVTAGCLKEKILVIMGATGCGKSGLSLQLASRFPSEIINSDKMQVYKGLDITLNKIPLHERHNVLLRLLGDVDSLHGESTPVHFRIRADNVVSDITSRKKLPILVGGSNSFIYAMLVTHFDPHDDVFSDVHKFISSHLRYRCCFLWLDVAFPVLSDYLSIRVDDMLQLGIFEELAEFYDLETAKTTTYSGITKAIGVWELLLGEVR